MESDKFKASFRYLAPVSFSLACAYAFSLIILEARPEGVIIVPFPEEGLGPALNALMIVTLMAGTAFLMYVLVKLKKFSIFRTVIQVAFGVLFLIMFFFYGFSVASLLDFNLNMISAPIIAVGVAITILALRELFRRHHDWKQTLVVLVVGGAVGAYMGNFIPTISAVMILLILCAYDVLTVYKGPVGKLVNEIGPDDMRGLSFTFKDLQMGLGDIVFYSMLQSHMTIFFGLPAGLAATVGLLTGVYVGLRVLEKRHTFPGLPIALLIGLALSGAVALL